MAVFNDKISFGEGVETGVDGTGYLGGATATSGDHPFIKGYFYVFFNLPKDLFTKAGLDVGNAQNYLMVSAENFTPPGDRQLNMQDVQGQGGVDSSFIVGQTITREFSVQYKDYWGAPIFRIHKVWTSYINPYLGVSTLAKDFAASEYKGTCMVIQTKPVKKETYLETDIIKVFLADGVVATTDLNSAYDANITDNSFVKPTVQYKFDGYPLDETQTINGQSIKNIAVSLLGAQKLFSKTEEKYSTLASNSEAVNTTTV